MSAHLSYSVQYVKSVGPKRRKAFEDVGINTIKDLLFYFPSKYLDRSNIVKISKALEYIQNGYEGELTIIAKVSGSEVIRYHKKSLMKVKLKDETGYLECIWFHGIRFFKDVFKQDRHFAVSGKPVLTRYGHLQIAHPDYDRLDDDETDEFINTGKIIPFYRIPKKLKESNIGDFSFRRIIRNVLENYSTYIEESLPAEIINSFHLLKLGETVANMHLPNSYKELESARTRMKFEEILYLHLLMLLRKKRIANDANANIIKVFPAPLKYFLNTLPFELTHAQLQVLSEIRKDLESGKIMNRLLQGDVGSGKTIVALITMIIVSTNAYQSVLLAPTEILASQHYTNISRLIKDLDIPIAILLGGQSKKQRSAMIEIIEKNNNAIIIGTHALIEANINFKRLGLGVIDEQHRFGVLQRSKLISKGINTHTLVMSATPIPRTLTMTLYGDLDVSIIKEMPQNRRQTKTYLRGENKLPKIYSFIRKRISLGEQAYIVYPLVEESDKIELKAAETHYNELKNSFFADIRVGLIHGKMKWYEKEVVMDRFARKEYDVLISTTVIEVGIDIPDATVILINDADRFGISQLHQLRGRVGRSDKQSYCILVAKEEFTARQMSLDFKSEYLSPLQVEKQKSKIRLSAVEKIIDGFKLSEIDFKLRGPGDIFGTKQSGLPELKYIDLSADAEIIADAKKAAANILEDDPDLCKEKNFMIKQNLSKDYSSHKNFSSTA